MRGSVIFIILLLCFFSCKKTDKSARIKEKENTLVGEKISIDPNSLISDSFSRKECNSEYKLILTFDGECSSCIVQFLEFVSNSKNLLKNWNGVFISFSQDVYEIEYYMSKSKITLDEFQPLLADKNQSFLEDNPFINSTNNIFIIDNQNEIVEQIGFYYKKEDVLKILNKYKPKIVY
jgi:hypothetical protein